jgi:eukaryotic-like serine/threonine-protein kinase
MVDDDDSKPPTTDERVTAVDEPRARPSDDRIVHERYRMVEVLARGGMGEVLVARDDQVGRDVAIKRMRAAAPSDRAIERFLREARIQGRLEHPAIVPVHEIGRTRDGLPFFAMKKLAGTTLAELVGPEAQLQPLLRAFVDVCLAVEFAHVRGVIHRDLKPENIVLGDFGEVYVLDWGIAKVIGEADTELGDIGSDRREDQTGQGTMVGTYGYMSPEQVRGEIDIDARADVYALGCVLFAILAGSELHPRGRAGLANALTGVDARPSLRAPGRGIPPELDMLCVTATALDRNARIATARELGDRVQRFLDGDRDLATRQQLARDHLERGRRAFAADDRSSAMREAGSALALDPALAGAAELLGRLMLEPPTVVPAEVEAALDHDEIETAKSNARDGTFIFLAILAFAPLLWWIAPASSPWPLLFAAPVVVCIALCWRGTVDDRHGARLGVLAVTSAVMLALISRMYTPLYIAPGFAAVAAMTILFTPSKSRLATPVGVCALMQLAVLGPWLLERLDVVSRTIDIDAAGAHLRAPAMGGNESHILIVTTLYAFTLVTIACIVAGTRRAHERATKRSLMLQTWQLRQLVPR